MTPQFLKRCARPILRGAPVRVPENLSKLVPCKKALGLVRPAVDDGDVVSRHEPGGDLRFFLVFASRVGAGGKVFAFEPDPEMHLCSEHNIEMNGLTASWGVRCPTSL
jgi:hypothetical protein